MNRYATAAGDKTDDRIAIDRTAAGGEVSQEVANPHDLQASGSSRNLNVLRRRQDFLFAMLCQSHGDPLRRYRSVAYGSQQVLVLRVLRKCPQQVVRSQVDAETSQLPLQDLFALGNVLISFLASKPTTYLLAGRR